MFNQEQRRQQIEEESKIMLIKMYVSSFFSPLCRIIVNSICKEGGLVLQENKDKSNKPYNYEYLQKYNLHCFKQEVLKTAFDDLESANEESRFICDCTKIVTKINKQDPEILVWQNLSNIVQVLMQQCNNISSDDIPKKYLYTNAIKDNEEEDDSLFDFNSKGLNQFYQEFKQRHQDIFTIPNQNNSNGNENLEIEQQEEIFVKKVQELVTSYRENKPKDPNVSTSSIKLIKNQANLDGNYLELDNLLKKRTFMQRNGENYRNQ
ncbi:hypothetical protein PPERSA_04382 [Pseudocohnilembus persalinus]|uniref:Uncharacterized protein n=1 Tax=Pseudocohnilembus persalinus TaxID=266149 RepID=A0A0V0QR04_PSEPJ|nr:hypothetical protein PPERSA_04382 [Pseudocohnilembus persalinus]|eukprot:KRX04567.1 hypothetical protein PPERSA_04382 [Pseudocohnilembus persalinus]